jgi:hypothetical protein
LVVKKAPLISELMTRPEIATAIKSTITFDPRHNYKAEPRTLNIFTDILINADVVREFMTPLSLTHEEIIEIVKPWLDHVRLVLAAGHDESYQFIMNWVYLLLVLREKLDVALVFWSKQGGGKSVFCEMLMDIIGADFSIEIQTDTALTGEFNDHLATKILACIEEATFAGDHRSQNALKSLETSKQFLMNEKFRSRRAIQSFLNLIFNSNDMRSVSVGLGDRRHACFEVDNKMCYVSTRHSGEEKSSYFTALRKIDPRIFMYYMTNIFEPIPDWHPRSNIPQTHGLLEMKKKGATFFEKYLIDAIELEQSKGEWEKFITIPIEELSLEWKEHCSVMQASRHDRLSKSQFMKRVSDVWGPFKQSIDKKHFICIDRDTAARRLFGPGGPELLLTKSINAKQVIKPRPTPQLSSRTLRNRSQIPLINYRFVLFDFFFLALWRVLFGRIGKPSILETLSACFCDSW